MDSEYDANGRLRQPDPDLAPAAEVDEVVFDDPPTLDHVTILQRVGSSAYPESVRERCFDLWMTTCGHNYAEVARQTGIREATLRQWGRRGSWSQRAYDLMLDVESGDIRPLTMINLQVASLECSRYFVEVAAGRAEPSRARTQLCQVVVDRAGYSPTHFIAMEKRAPATRPIDLPDLSQMTADELAQLEARLIAAGGE